MSRHDKEFATLNEILFKRRIEALEVIYSYLQQNDIENLTVYIASEIVKTALLPPELAFLESLTRLYYGAEASSKPNKKLSH